MAHVSPRREALLLPLVLLSCLLPRIARAQLDPGASLEALQPAEGLEASLFAAEPMVVNPTCLDVDPAGRVWICEGVNYRGKARPPHRPTGDRIVRLEDTDGDGRADKSVVFYEGLDLESPLGICYLGDRIFVSQSPDIFTIDIRPDGTAGEKRVLLTGFGGRNHDHGVHSVLLGPDGLLYCAFGNEGANVTDRSGKPIRSDGKPCFGGMVFRCQLDGTQSEILAHNFRNNYECALDSFGNIWQSDNDDDGNRWVRFTYVMQGGNYGFLGPTGRHWSQEGKSHFHMEDPGVVPSLLRTGAGSPTGLCVYEGDLLPERYRGKPLHCDAGPRVVQVFDVKPLGAGWHVAGAPLDGEGRQTVATLSEIVQPEILLTSKDPFFRPSDVAVAPDGSLLIADWYDPGVGGHGVGDLTRGRVWRVAPRGHRGYKSPTFDLETADGLAAAFASPALATRSLATLKLIEQSESALPVLRRILALPSPALQARALWLIARLKEGRQTLVELLKSPDQRFRVLAVRGLKQVAPGDFVDLVRAAAQDDDPQVRREILVSLRDVRTPGAMELLVGLARRHDGHDRWYLEAIGIAARGREGELFQQLAAGWQGTWDATASSITWELRPAAAVPHLASLAAKPGLDGAARREVLRSLTAIETPEAGQVVLRMLADGGAAAELRREAAASIESRLDGKWSSLQGDALQAAALGLLASPGLEEAGARLAAAGKLRGLRAEVESAARSSAATEPVRLAALRALGAIDDAASVPALRELLVAGPEACAQEAARALAAMSGAAPQDALRGVLLGAESPETRSAAVKALGGTRSGAVLILHLAQSGELPDAARALATTLMHSSAYEEVRLMAQRILPLPKTEGGKQLPPLAELAQRRGDAEKGLRTFFSERKANCGRCHKVNGKGSTVGPDLSAIGTKLGKQGLLEAILSPSAAVSHEYRVWILQTKSAGFVSGYVVDESGGKVTLRDANGKEIAFASGDILSRQPSEASLMPEGLVGAMTVDDLIDVVELLTTLRSQAAVPGGK